jgi:Protein of unknown function (DUF3224).
MFDVKLTPQEWDDKAERATLGRMSIDKRFHGDLEATSKGEMLTAGTAVEGSAGYVAIERVSGTLQGRSGTFVLQHSGTMTRGAPLLTIAVVPDSGTGQLLGLAGRMTKIDGGKHSYDFEYMLAETPLKAGRPSFLPLAIEFADELFRGAASPRGDETIASDGFGATGQTDAGSAPAPPRAFHRGKHVGRRLREDFLFIGRQLHHRPTVFRRQRGEDLPADSEIRVSHVSALDRARQLESKLAKNLLGHFEALSVRCSLPEPG